LRDEFPDGLPLGAGPAKAADAVGGKLVEKDFAILAVLERSDEKLGAAVDLGDERADPLEQLGLARGELGELTAQRPLVEPAGQLDPDALCRWGDRGGRG